MTGSLDSLGQLSLMLCASACDSAGQNFSSLGSKLSESCNILIIDVFYLSAQKTQTFFFFLFMRTGCFCISFSIIRNLLYYFCCRNQNGKSSSPETSSNLGASTSPVEKAGAGYSSLLPSLFLSTKLASSATTSVA